MDSRTVALGLGDRPYMAVMLTMKRFRSGTISRLTLLAAASLLTLSGSVLLHQVLMTHLEAKRQLDLCCFAHLSVDWSQPALNRGAALAAA
ncbi:MAG: hypothetical protein HC886_08100 [Leptolyngbyaceae cyanobacterium SM1_1_3]|nr:hypothetical protein [Leptolyngbyaceae cyanobacterium SM1_1_3]